MKDIEYAGNITDDEIKAAQTAAYIAYKMKYKSEPYFAELIEKFQRSAKTSKLQIIEFHKTYGSKKYSAGCVIELDDTIFIAYRGTSPKILQEMYNDSKARKIDVAFRTKDGLETFQIHQGFKEEYDACKAEINDILKQLKSNNKKIICCGHSLGGAMASIASLKLACNGRKDIKCITFGTPKVFSRDTAERFDQMVDCVRVNDVNDIVPLYPVFRMDYSHAGISINTDAGHNLFAHAMSKAYQEIRKAQRDSNSYDDIGIMMQNSLNSLRPKSNKKAQRRNTY